MEDVLIDILSEYGFPVRRQGSFASDEEYPDYFFTFWNTDSSDHSHFDNRRMGIESTYDVMFYGIDAAKVYDTLRDAQQKLINNGWISSGDGFDVASDEESHTGRGITATFLKI